MSSQPSLGTDSVFTLVVPPGRRLGEDATHLEGQNGFGRSRNLFRAFRRLADPRRQERPAALEGMSSSGTYARDVSPVAAPTAGLQHPLSQRRSKTAKANG
jgi:hypothetical protein